MRKRRAFAALILICVMLLLPLPVSANSPPPKDWFEIVFCNLPEGTAYVEMLVYLPESDPYYTELVEENLPEGFSVNAEIVTYCVDDFRSYTFHYRDAKSTIGVKDTDCAYFFFDNAHSWGNIISGDSIRYKHLDDVLAKGEIRLAMLDAEGDILHISPIFRLETRKFMGYLKRDFVYNGANDTLQMEEGINTFGYVLYVFLAGMGFLLTWLVEWLVSVLMGLQYKAKVGTVNLVSQTLMHILYIAFYSVIFWRYTVALILLELLVYAGEFLAYRFWIMRDLSTKKCLIFTITANTASLGLGILLLRALGMLS